MENKQSPAAAIKQILGSGKILFICIICTIAALSAFGDVFDSRLNFDNFEIFGQEINLGELIGYEMVEILNFISDALFIFGIIGMLPKLLVAVAFWMVKIGSKDGDKNTKTALLGFNFFKINFMYKAVTQILGLFVLGLLGIVIIIGTVSAGVDNPTLILIEVVILALVCGYFYFFFKYNTNYVAMLTGATQTLRTNVNLVVKSNQVIVFNYIVAIYLIISSFGNDLWGIIAGICDALCLIFVNQCFANFAKTCGYAQPDESKKIMERVKNDPALEKTAKALGIARTYSSDPAEQKQSIGKFFINSVFGLSIAYIDGTTPYAPTATDTRNVNSTVQNVSVQKSSEVSTFAYRQTADITDDLPIRFLRLFPNTVEIEDARYTVAGEYLNLNTPLMTIIPCVMQVVVDAVSEKKLLRVIFKNNTSETIKEIKFNVIPKTNESSALGVYKSVSIKCSAQSGEYFGGENGLILPDDATCGTVVITHVDFADGMFRDKASEEFYFSTSEKEDFDARRFLLSMNDRYSSAQEAETNSSPTDEKTDCSQQEKEESNEVNTVSNSPLPLILAISAVVICIFLAGFLCWAFTFNGVSLVASISLILALSAITVRKKNPKQEFLICTISACASVFSIWMFFHYVYISAIVSGIVFGIIAILKKDRKFLIAIGVSLAFMIILLIFYRVILVRGFF